MDSGPESVNSGMVKVLEKKETDIRGNMRGAMIVESIIFQFVGIASFLSLIFLTTQEKGYVIAGIIYGIFNFIGGSIGLYAGYKIIVAHMKIFCVALIIIALLNLLATVIYCMLFVQYAMKGMPDCSSDCTKVKAWYVAMVSYYLFEVVSSAGLLFVSLLAIKHSTLFYKLESR